MQGSKEQLFDHLAGDGEQASARAATKLMTEEVAIQSSFTLQFF
jgi:hypothetical protein